MTGSGSGSGSMPAGPPLPYHDHRHLAAAQFLVEEAHLLDTGRYHQWLDLLDRGIRYRMPVRVSAAKGADESALATMHHFDEDWYSLRKRVERFYTDSAWTEDPPSRLRHHVTNVRTFAPDDGALVVESAVLLFRSRGDRTEPSVVSAGRTDRLVTADGGPAGLRLRSRDIVIDEAVLRTQNLAVFL